MQQPKHIKKHGGLAVGNWTGFRNLRAKKRNETKKSLSFRENIFSCKHDTGLSISLNPACDSSSTLVKPWGEFLSSQQQDLMGLYAGTTQRGEQLISLDENSVFWAEADCQYQELRALAKQETEAQTNAS